MRADWSRRAALLGAVALVAGCGGGPGQRRSLAFAVVGERVMLRGRITARSARELRDVLDAVPGITTVVLQAVPAPRGAGAAMALGRVIRARGLDTALQSDSDVFGAAVLVFLAGRRRSMVEGAQIAVARWDADDAEAVQGYLREMLGDDAFYGFVLRLAPPAGIQVLTQAQIVQQGLLTAPVTVWNEKGE